MKINQVEELVGITKKNIRFYEEQGLIMPERNPENGYREYTLKDVEQLKKVKLFRQLALSIEQIRALLADEISVDRCLEEHIQRLSHEQHNLEITKEICQTMAGKVDSIQKLNSEEYLHLMSRLEEGGAKFMNVQEKDVRRKTIGSIVAASVFALFIVALIALFLWLNSVEGAPAGIFIFYIGIFALVLIGVIVALCLRLKEIRGGEEDEAGKY